MLYFIIGDNMEDQNKKQIVIIVVIIIILILSLLGLLIFAVITNDGANVDISNTTLPTTTISSDTTTIPVETTESVEGTTVASSSGNREIVNKLYPVVKTYIDNINADGKIGEYTINEINIFLVDDESKKCPNREYLETMIYAQVLIEYPAGDSTSMLTINDKIVDDKVVSNLTFEFNFDGTQDLYIVEDMFGC